jgi:hypothetical protein
VLIRNLYQKTHEEKTGSDEPAKRLALEKCHEMWYNQ